MMARGTPAQSLPDGSAFVPVGTTYQRFTDDFGGTALNATKWEVEANVGGMTYGVTGSNLTVNMGTTANAELRLLSREVFTVPFDLDAILQLSQRIANNLVYVEFVEVDFSTGKPIDAANIAGDWANRASVLLDGTSATVAKLETVGEDSTAILSQSGTITTTASPVNLNVEIRAKDVQLLSVAPDSASARSGNILLNSSQVPDPNKPYKLRLRFKNGASAPASNTVVTLKRIFVYDGQELSVELTSGRGDTNASRAVPVSAAASSAVIGLTKETGTSATDVTSAAITSTGTAGAFTPVSLSGGYQVVIPVTAVAGTSPTMDVVVQESDDGGTNWFDVYHFERIIATGVYRSPMLPLTGNRVRYVQTIGGTSPSFTRAIMRNENPTAVAPCRRKFFSRTLDVNTLNNATAWFNIEGCDKVEALVALTYGTASPTIAVDVSDDAGITSYGAAIGTLSSWTVSGSRVALGDLGGAKFARLRTSVAGVGNSGVIARLAAWKG